MKTHALNKSLSEGGTPMPDCQAADSGEPAAPSLLQLSIKYKPQYEILRVIYG